MSSKEILINSNTMKGMETDVASSTMGIKEVTARDYETTIAGNANSIECYEACNNVVTAMNNALNRDAKKIAKAHNGFKDFDNKIAKCFGKK